MKTTILFLTSFFLLSIGVCAQPKLDTKKSCADTLKLTDEQKVQLKNIRFDNRKKTIDLRAEIQKARIDVESVISSNKPDRSTFEKLNKTIAALQLEQKMILFDTDAKVKSILTDDQKKLYEQIRNERRSQRREKISSEMNGHNRQRRHRMED